MNTEIPLTHKEGILPSRNYNIISKNLNERFRQSVSNEILQHCWSQDHAMPNISSHCWSQKEMTTLCVAGDLPPH